MTSGYTGYSDAEAEQTGVYLVLQASSSNENAVITAEIVDKIDASVKVLDNNIIIAHSGFLFGDQKLKVTASADGYMPATKEFALLELTASEWGDIIWNHEEPTYVNPDPIDEPGVPPYS